MEYRIEEYLGRFIIQAKKATVKTKGFLWWKTTIEEVEWSRVAENGRPMFYFRDFCSPPLKAFKTLEEAKAMVELFKKGPQYHNA